MSKMVVRYKDEILYSIEEKEDEVLLHTMDGGKAKRLALPRVDRGEYGMWVPREEIEEVGPLSDFRGQLL